MIALHEPDLEPVILQYMKLTPADLWSGLGVTSVGSLYKEENKVWLAEM